MTEKCKIVKDNLKRRKTGLINRVQRPHIVWRVGCVATLIESFLNYQQRTRKRKNVHTTEDKEYRENIEMQISLKSDEKKKNR